MRGEEGKGMLPSVALGSGAAVQNTPKPLPAPHARIVQPRRSAPLACRGKGREGSGFRVLGTEELEEREGRGGNLQPLEEGFELGLVGGVCCHGRCSMNCREESGRSVARARKRTRSIVFFSRVLVRVSNGRATDI